jgi:hypothetical protein
MIPDTYRRSNFESELRELLELAQDAAQAACNANACGTQCDSRQGTDARSPPR